MKRKMLTISFKANNKTDTIDRKESKQRPSKREKKYSNMVTLLVMRLPVVPLLFFIFLQLLLQHLEYDSYF